MDRDDGLLADRPVDVGAALFALHDPHRGHEVAFNRYYERDHMYSAAIFAPFTIAGQRWVATRDLKACRVPAAGPFGPATAGSYLTMYWIQDGHLGDQQAWVSEQMRALVAAGRTFDERDVQIATVFDRVATYRRDVDGVPPFLALDHRYPGCAWLLIERAPDVSLAACASWVVDELLPAGSSGGASPVELALAFTPRPKEPWWPAAAPEVAGVGSRLAVTLFLDRDPRGIWEDHLRPLADRVAASPQAELLLLAPFIPTVPGTDTYVDELW